MVALERINEFSTIAQEAPEFVEPRPSASWPEKGDISVENLTIRYAPTLPNVLHGLTFEIKSKSKIGTSLDANYSRIVAYSFIQASWGALGVESRRWPSVSS